MVKINIVTIMGRMVKDPELRHTPNQTAVTSFTLAVDRGYVPKDSGERQVDFIDIIAWRNTAEFVAKYFEKGQMMAVVGKLQLRDWVDKEGNKRRSAEVIADSVHFTGSKKDNGTPTPSPGVEFEDVNVNDGELPF